MGASMALNLLKCSIPVIAYDISAASVAKIVAGGGIGASGLSDIARSCPVVITMLPSSPHVASTVDSLLSHGWADLRTDGTKMLIDSSTIDPLTSRSLHALLAEERIRKIDAPVSGGVKGAEAGTLTFMVGADAAADLDAASTYLAAMGSSTVHCGPVGAGQSAKLCNNLAMAVQMVSVAEALNLGEKLGLDPAVLAGVMNASTSRCWSGDSCSPHPAVAGGSPAAEGYEGGFGVDLMLKDLRLACAAAEAVGSPCPLGKGAEELYGKASEAGMGRKDFGVVLQYLRGGEEGGEGGRARTGGER